MQPDFPDELIERSLDAAIRFADTVLPLAHAAFRFSVTQVQLVPDQGMQLHDSNLQALPNLFRLNLLKLVAGHNRDQQVPPIRRRGSPNNGLWLGIAGSDLMARVYKVSKRHAVARSGTFQERLITQARYQQLREQPVLYELEDTSLDALLMWQSQGYEMTGAYVVIPNGWDSEDRLQIVGRRDLVMPDDLENIAAFTSTDDDTAVIPGPTMPIVVPRADAVSAEDSSLLEEELEEFMYNQDPEIESL